VKAGATGSKSNDSPRIHPDNIFINVSYAVYRHVPALCTDVVNYKNKIFKSMLPGIDMVKYVYGNQTFPEKNERRVS
jgi:hypothetical protein